MDLSRIGREFFVEEIVTNPVVDGWAASFDGGQTWEDGEAVPDVENTWRWLVRGPDFVEADAPVQAASQLVATSPIEPLLRAIDNPEVVVRTGSRVSLV